MFNCCHVRQSENEIDTTEPLRLEISQEDHTSPRHQRNSRPSHETMSSKYPVFRIFSSNRINFFKRRTKNRLNESTLSVQNSKSPEISGKQHSHTEGSSAMNSKSDESEKRDSLGNLPFTNSKHSFGKINFLENDINVGPSDHNIPTATVATSRRGSLYIFRHSDDLIVTPFAQILASLRNVRANYILITNAQSSRDARFGSTSASRHTLSSYDGKPEVEDSHKSLTQKTLDELEWCLERLESIQTHRSVSDMASRKFKKILNKELCQYVDGSKSGNQISDYICTTFLDSNIDNSLDQSADADDQIDSTHRRTSSGGKIRERSDSIAIDDRSADGQTISSPNVSRTGTGRSGYIPLPDTDNVSKLGIVSSRNSELVKIIGTSLDTWGMDIFLVSTLSDNKPLTVISFALFRKFNLFEKFSIQPSILLRFITEIEGHYHDDVSYHNSIHAADVTQSVNVLLEVSPLESVFSDLEVMSVIFACIVHDVDHPGVTNQYLINTNDQLALLYNDSSVLENHHLSVAFNILSKSDCNAMVHLTKKQTQSFRKMVIDMVLATDMSKHMSLLADLKTMVETKKVAGSGILNLDNYTDRIKILQNMVHCADLSNPTKPLELYKVWTAKIMQEFFEQGDKEKERNLDISPMCDRETATIEKSQVSFIDFIVHPLWETWSDLVYPEAQDILDSLEENREWYFSQIPKCD